MDERFNRIESGNIIFNGANIRNKRMDKLELQFENIGSVILTQSGSFMNIFLLCNKNNEPKYRYGSAYTVYSGEFPVISNYTEWITIDSGFNYLNSAFINNYSQYVENLQEKCNAFSTENPDYLFRFVQLNLANIDYQLQNEEGYKTEIICNANNVYSATLPNTVFYRNGGFELVNIPMNLYENEYHIPPIYLLGQYDPSAFVAQYIANNSDFFDSLEFGKLPNDYNFYVPWVVYLDGERAPLLSLTAEIDETNETYLRYGADMKVHVQYVNATGGCNYNDLTTLPLLSLPYNTSFDAVMKLTDPNLFNKLIGLVGQLIDNFIPNTYFTVLQFWVEYTTDTGKVKTTDKCRVTNDYRRPSTPDGVITSKATNNDNSSITVKFGYPNEKKLEDSYSEYDGSTIDPDELSDTDIDTGDNTSYNAVSVLTTTYAMTEDRLKQLGSKLWSDSFLENIQLLNNSPIENILSCKAFPFSINGTDETIVLGNVNMGVTGSKVGRNYNFRRTIGTFKIEKKYNSFLDYEPYTSVKIYLPFIGYKELTPSVVMDKTIKIDYVIDIVTGVCKVIIFADNVQILDFDGSCGIDIPITSSNRAQVEMGYVTSALGVVTDTLTGNALNTVNDVINSAMIQNHSSTSGTASPSCSAYTSKDIFIIYNRPQWQDLKTFNHVHGRMCNLSRNLNSLKGFTKCNENTDLSHLTCTLEEKERIRNYLTSGVIL